jgi:hypothetical protein
MSTKQQEWIKNLGKNLIKSIEIKIGDTIIYDSKNDPLFNINDKEYDYKKMIGDEELLQKQQTLHVPLDFYCDKNNVIIQKENVNEPNIFNQNPKEIFIEL